jgi:GNAT superfamily N-acetyltransferase
MPDASDFQIAPLDSSHHRGAFDCGQEALNLYLRQLATQDVRRNLAQTYVMIREDLAVVGYYTLSAGTIEHIHLPATARKKLPRYPIPAALIGRLAVDRNYRGQGLARKLLGDALHRAAAISNALGIHAVVVDAKDEMAAGFYRKFGFITLSDSPLHLYLPIKTIKTTI